MIETIDGNLALAVMLGLAVRGTAAQANTPTIVDEWASIKAPAAPELKSVTPDPKATALLVLDFVDPNCLAPALHGQVAGDEEAAGQARAKGMPAAFATGPTGKRADILPDVAPLESETVMSAGVDKFVDTGLEKVLRSAGTQAVFATGTSAHGAVLYTASAGVARQAANSGLLGGRGRRGLVPR